MPARSSGEWTNFRAMRSLGNEAACEVERTTCDVSVHVDAAGKHQHPRCVDRAARGADGASRDSTASPMEMSLTIPSTPLAGS